jgi:aryl sulfotransferase
MTDTQKIIWLASYPKSGNTWFRIFLANLLAKNEIPTDINSLFETNIASNRQLFDEISGVGSSDLTLSEIERLRPYVYEAMAQQSEETIFLKIHDALVFTQEGKPIISEKASLKAVYILRNPLDVAVSLAHHLSVPVEMAVDILCNNAYSFCNRRDRLQSQLEQRLLSWSNHVISWTQQSVLPVQVIRYEDMLNDGFNTFKKAVSFCHLELPDEAIERSLKFSDFTELQKQENQKGFRERASGDSAFFRKGKFGSWREEMSSSLADKLIQAHATIMLQYGYLDKSGNPVY